MSARHYSQIDSMGEKMVISVSESVRKKKQPKNYLDWQSSDMQKAHLPCLPNDKDTWEYQALCGVSLHTSSMPGIDVV